MRLALLLALTTLGSFQSPPADSNLRGLWLKQSADQREFRFYYFHTNGIGLYRYGRRNLNNTNSFDYRVDGKELVLRFRKTGEDRRVRFKLEKKGKETWLLLENDPRERGPTKYRRVDGPLDHSLDHPFARMWTEQKKFATGGIGFRIYQFQPPDGSGRGHGWYHQGDYDDWFTEAFEYEKSKGRSLLTARPPAALRASEQFSGSLTIRFHFLEKQEIETTDFSEFSGPKRAIELMSDPRNFWHRARFEDGGRTIIGSDLLSPLFVH
jgi:hypothetical protein